MPGSRRGGDRPAFATARGPAPARAHRLTLPFRLATLLAAQMFDFATFTIMVGKHGIAAEANPLVAGGFATFGMPILALMKIALVALLASIVVILARERPRRRFGLELAALVSVLAVAGGMLGGISNVLAT